MHEAVKVNCGEGQAGPVTSEIRAWLEQALDEGRTELDAAARHLDVSSRTLRRRLQGEGRTFQGLLDDVRRTRALSLLTEGVLPISEVSRVLGFTRITSFYRAFRRWTQTTPAAYRTLQRGGEAAISVVKPATEMGNFRPPSEVLAADESETGVVSGVGYMGQPQEGASYPA